MVQRKRDRKKFTEKDFHCFIEFQTGPINSARRAQPMGMVKLSLSLLVSVKQSEKSVKHKAKAPSPPG
jgi:hypothetical protein